MSAGLAESTSSDNDSYRMISESDSSDASDEGTRHSPWLDKEALQPCVSDETTGKGFSTLCRACHAFFRGKREMEVKYKHILRLATLRDTASRGCCLCALIHQTVDRETVNHYPADIPKIYLELYDDEAGGMRHVVDIIYHYRCGSKRAKYGRFVHKIKGIRMPRLIGQYSLPCKDHHYAFRRC